MAGKRKQGGNDSDQDDVDADELVTPSKKKQRTGTVTGKEKDKDRSSTKPKKETPIAKPTNAKLSQALDASEKVARVLRGPTPVFFNLLVFGHSRLRRKTAAR